jgi:hypothetical protein
MLRRRSCAPGDHVPANHEATAAQGQDREHEQRDDLTARSLLVTLFTMVPADQRSRNRAEQHQDQDDRITDVRNHVAVRKLIRDLQDNPADRQVCEDDLYDALLTKLGKEAHLLHLDIIFEAEFHKQAQVRIIEPMMRTPSIPT